MPWLKAIVVEIFGLFVDDGPFALAIPVWLGARSLGSHGLAADGMEWGDPVCWAGGDPGRACYGRSNG